MLAAMTGSVPKAERKLRQATLQEEAAARADGRGRDRNPDVYGNVET